jgi:ubiquinone/menaquinone biosynthesis C-methylase UbiE
MTGSRRPGMRPGRKIADGAPVEHDRTVGAGVAAMDGETVNASGGPRRSSGVAAAFDAVAGSYEEGRLAIWYQAQADMVLQTVGPLGSGLALDVGCGTGWLLRQLLRDRPWLRGLGIDVSTAMVETARRKAASEGIPNVEFRSGDWERPAAPEAGARTERARVVTCVSTFHYFRDPLGALRRMRAALEPGGRLLLLDRDTAGAPLTAAWDLAHRYLIRDGCRFFRADEIVRLLERAGFEEARVESKVQRWFWHGKALTSLALLSARCPADASPIRGRHSPDHQAEIHP